MPKTISKLSNESSGNYVTWEFVWEATASEKLNAETLIDVSTLANADDDSETVALQILQVSANVHFIGSDAADMAVFLTDSNNVTLYKLHNDSNGMFKFETCCNQNNTDEYSNNATGDVKVAVGQTIARSNGATTGNADAGSFAHVTVRALKVRK